MTISDRIQKVVIEHHIGNGVSDRFTLMCSVAQAEVVAERIRMAYPENCVNVVWDWNGEHCESFTMYTSWNVQMNEYPNTEVHTPEGEAVKEMALAACGGSTPTEEAMWRKMERQAYYDECDTMQQEACEEQVRKEKAERKAEAKRLAGLKTLGGQFPELAALMSA